MKKPRILEGPFFFTRHSPAKIDAKLPSMFRAVDFTRAEIKQEERIVPIVFATETPVLRWFGRERLICTPEAFRGDRFNNGGAFLHEHDRQQQIGRIVPASTAFGADRKGRTQLQFSKNSELAEQEWKDVNDAIRGLFSVGYIVHRLVLREEDDEKGDLYDAMDWEGLEVSLVSIPADVDCGVDASRAEKELTYPVAVSTDDTTKRPLIDPMKKRSKYFARFFHAKDDGGGSGGSGGTGTATEPPPATPPAGTPGESRANTPAPGNNGAENERTRCKSLAKLGQRHNCGEKMGEFIDNGTSVEEAQRWVLDNRISGGSGSGAAPRPLLTGGTPGGGNGDQNSPLNRSLGSMLVEHAGFREIAAMGREKKRAAMEIPALSIREISTRATLATGSLEATQRLPGIVLLDQQRLTISDLLLPGTTSGNRIEYPRENSYTNAAASVAEGATKPEATFDIVIAEAVVRKIAVTAKISDEMLADFAYVRSYVDSRLVFMIEEREEVLLLYGNGVAPNILGLTVTPNVQAHAKGDDSIADALHKAITKVRVNGRAEPTGLVMHPNDWERLALAKDDNGQYYGGGPFYAPYGNGTFVSIVRVWGLPVVITTSITEGTAFLGAFRTQAQLFRREGITIESTNSNEDDFKKNLIALRAEERVALCVYRPAAFINVTGLNA